jgi:hypothetical protein
VALSRNGSHQKRTKGHLRYKFYNHEIGEEREKKEKTISLIQEIAQQLPYAMTLSSIQSYMVIMLKDSRERKITIN